MTAREDVVVSDRPRSLTAIGWLVVVVYCWFAGRFESFTWKSTTAVLIPGMIIFGMGVARPPARRPPLRPVGPRGAALWSVPLLSFCVLEVVDDLLGSTYAHPTLSVLMDSVLEVHVWRSMAYFAWIVLGWALVKR